MGKSCQSVRKGRALTITCIEFNKKSHIIKKIQVLMQRPWKQQGRALTIPQTQTCQDAEALTAKNPSNGLFF